MNKFDIPAARTWATAHLIAAIAIAAFVGFILGAMIG